MQAKQLDDLHISGGGQKGKKKGKLEEEEEEEPEESFDDYEKRVNAFVTIALATASSSKRDDYKSGLVFEERRQVIHEFMKTILLKKCKNANCGA